MAVFNTAAAGTFAGQSYFLAPDGFYCAATTPSTRLAADGLRHLLVTHLNPTVAGRSGSRVIEAFVRNSAGTTLRSTSSFTVPSGSAAIAQGAKALTGGGVLLRGGTSYRWGYTQAGGLLVGRRGAGTIYRSDTGAATSWDNNLVIDVTYAQVPAAPTIGTLTPSGGASAALTWTAPIDTGDTALTGYRIEYSTSPVFATVQSVTVAGAATSHTLTGLTPGLLYYVRVAALNAVTTAAGTSSPFSATLTVTAVATVGDLDGWQTFGTLDPGLTPLIGDGLRRGHIPSTPPSTGLVREIEHSGSGSVSGLGMKRTVTGLSIGKTYKLTGNAIWMGPTAPTAKTYRFEVPGIGTGASVTLSDEDAAEIPEYTFEATGTSHEIRIALVGTVPWSGAGWLEQAGFYGIKLWLIPDPTPYRLQDTVYEGPLSTHFDYACDSVGAHWWVDRHNITRFQQAASLEGVKAVFTDRRAEGKHEYIDIQASYNTRDLVNEIEVFNHGRTHSGEANDHAFVRKDDIARELWGARSAQTDMTLRAGYVVAENLVANPSAEVDTANWQIVGGNTTLARSTTHAVVGTACFAVTTTLAGASSGLSLGSTRSPVTAGETYTFSYYVRCTVTRNCQGTVRFYNAAGTLLSTHSNTSTSVTGGANWSRRSVTATAPAGAVTANYYTVLASTGNGEISYWDGLMFHEGAAPVTYFDGDTPSTEDLTYEWTGESHESASILRDWSLMNQRLDEILATHATPEVSISRIRWNAQEDPALAARLDIQDRIRVEFQGISQDRRIIGIAHDMTATRWMVDLTLTNT